jgi:hypothetical protein
MKGRVVLLLALAGCPSPKPAPPPKQTTAPSALPTPTPTLAPPPSASAAPTTRVAEPEPTAPVFVEDPGAWFASHGAKPPADVDRLGGCTPTHLGNRDALICHGGAPTQSLAGGESVFSLRIETVDGGRAATALDAPIAAGPLDPELSPGESPDDAQYVVLDASLDAAGTTLTIRDKPGKTCNQALAQYQGVELAPHRRVIQRACSARGRYVLRGAKLVREKR